MRRPGRAVVALAALCLAGPAPAAPPIWTVHGRQATIILFGAVHVLPPGLDWRPKALTDAVAGADEVWFELPIGGDSDTRAIQALRRRGALRPGETLAARLKPGQWARLTQAAAAVGVPPASLEVMQPWLAEVTLSLAVDARAGAVAAEGVERRIQADAPATALRKAFETAEQQVGFLAGETLADQLSSLDLTLGEIADKPDSYDRTLRAWLDGDLAALAHEDLDPLKAAAPGAYRRLISDRNHRWAGILKQRLGRSGLVVVVVGVGHLVGPDGVPALLRSQGVIVEGP